MHTEAHPNNEAPRGVLLPTVTGIKTYLSPQNIAVERVQIVVETCADLQRNNFTQHLLLPPVYRVHLMCCVRIARGYMGSPLIVDILGGNYYIIKLLVSGIPLY